MAKKLVYIYNSDTRIIHIDGIDCRYANLMRNNPKHQLFNSEEAALANAKQGTRLCIECSKKREKLLKDNI